jgi:type I restriction enzyme S subunit
MSEVGVIPEEWEVKELDKVIDLLTGFPFQSNQYSSSGIRLLRGSNIKRGVTDWSDDLTKFWQKITPDLKSYSLNEGDIVIAMDGSLVGRSFARLSKRDLPALLLQRVARIRSNKIDVGYLKEFICSDYFTKYCDGVKTVTAIPHISPDDIKKFQIPLPPTIEEQEAIASALSDVDALIAALEQLITKKRNIKQGAMQQLLTGEKRLPGFGGAWEVKRLGEIANFYSGGTPSTSNSAYYGGEIAWITSSDLNKKIILSVEGRITQKGLENSSAKMVEKNTLLIALYGATAAVIAITKIKAAINQAVLAIMPQEHDTQYIYYKISSLKTWIINTYTQGGQPNLSGNIVKSIALSLPPRPEQQAIAKILTDMDADIEALGQKQAKYKALKQGMMQDLLTGKTRLV